MDLVHETEVQDPAGVLRHCLQFVLVGWFMQLFQMVPLPIPPQKFISFNLTYYIILTVCKFTFSRSALNELKV